MAQASLNLFSGGEPARPRARTKAKLTAPRKPVAADDVPPPPAPTPTTPVGNGGGWTKGYFRRSRYLYDPRSSVPFRLSRSKLENFMRCPRCFYLDVRLGLKQPDSYPLTLNVAVDHLLKKEFDAHRAKRQAHPLMTAYGIDAIPFSHPELEQWRENFTGVQALHRPTNLLLFGAVDDIWINPNGELIVVDYKATAKEGAVTLDADWQDGYKRQMEIYQWLLRQNGFPVANTGYFVYANGKKDREAFDAMLEFDLTIIPYTGSDHWVEPLILQAKACLDLPKLPPATAACDFCGYRKAVRDVEA